MASEVFNLAILLSVKDAASGGLDRFGAKLRAVGKDGQIAVDQLDKIRANLNRDLAIGGIGLGVLASLKKGVDEAGNLEESLLDLSQAYKENTNVSAYSAEQQQQQIKRIMSMATELGNQLQGNTGDYVQIFTAMNKAGIDAETTLNGAGKAAAYLANLTGAIRLGTAPQLAEDLGSYGKMFDLQGEEYIKAVNTFSAIKDRFNLDSGNLIEASKYFFSTAKGTMNLRGFQGSEETAKLFAFVKRYAGREGSEAGTSLDALITQFIAHRDKVEALSKDKGIKLDFFDSKGNFQGVENMFAQLEKMRKLSPEERASRLNGIFGEQGSRIANSMVEQGVQGWKNISTEMSKAIDVQTLINEKMSTYNSKTEALAGSWQNFKATAFTPLMEDAKTFIDYGNNIVTTFQKFSAENPGLTDTVTTFVSLGATAMVVYSGFKTLTTGVRLFRLASTFSRGEGLIPYLNQTSAAANAASTSIGAATTQAKGLRGALQSQTVRIGVQIGAIMGIEYLLGVIQSEIQKALDAGRSKNQAATTAQNAFETWKNVDADLKSQGLSMPQNDVASQASAAWFSALNMGLKYEIPSQFRKLSFTEAFSYSAKQSALFPISSATDSLNPFKQRFDERTFAAGFKQTTPQLADSRIMLEFLRQIDTRIPNKDEQHPIFEALRNAFPSSFADAMAQLRGETTTLSQSFMTLSEQTNAQKQNAELMNQQAQTIQSFGQNLGQAQNEITNLGNSAQKVPPSLHQISNAANRVTSSLNVVSERLSSWQPPIPQVQTYQIGVQPGTPISPSIIPSHAVGGIVERDGVAMLHAGNVITPAKTTRGLSGFSTLMSLAQQDRRLPNINLSDVPNIKLAGNKSSDAPVVIHYAPNLTVQSDSPEAKKEFRAMLYEHSKDLERIVARQMELGRIRS